MDKLKEPFFHDYKQKQDKKIDETRKSDNLFLKNCRFVNKLKVSGLLTLSIHYLCLFRTMTNPHNMAKDTLAKPLNTAA